MKIPKKSLKLDDIFTWSESYLFGFDLCHDMEVIDRWKDSIVGVYIPGIHALSHE